MVPVVVPCFLHSASQPSGVTWTVIRRRHEGQTRGGSSSSRWRQRTWLYLVADSPQ